MSVLCHPPKGRTRSGKLGQWCNRKRLRPLNKWPPTLADAPAPIAELGQELGQENSFHLSSSVCLLIERGLTSTGSAHTIETARGGCKTSNFKQAKTLLPVLGYLLYYHR